MNVIDIRVIAKDFASGVFKGIDKNVKDFGNKLKSAASGISDSFKKLGDSIISVGKKVGIGLLAAGAGAVKMASDAANNLELQSFFISKFGEDTEESLGKLREASKGTVSDIDLMSASNRAALLGVADETETLAGLMETARVRGKAMGVDTTAAFNDIVTGIGRGSPLILDNLGILIPEAFKEASKEMSETEKKQALVNLVMEDGAKLAEELGGDVLTAADKFAQMKAGVSNLRQEIGERLIPIVFDFIDSAKETYNELKDRFGPQIEDIKEKALILAGKLGDELTPRVGDLKDMFFDAIENILLFTEDLLDFVDEHPDIVKAIGAVAVAVGGLALAFALVNAPVALFATLGALIVTNWEPVKETIKIIYDRVSDLNGMMDSLKRNTEAFLELFGMDVGAGSFFAPGDERAITLGESAQEHGLPFNPTPLTERIMDLKPLPWMNWFATGTEASPAGKAVVGEEGPEIVDLPVGTRVIPAKKSAEMMGNKYDMNITVNHPVNPETLARNILFNLNL